MPALDDARKEKACQEYVLNGGDQSKAYRAAYPGSAKWKDKTVWARASELFADSKVKGRVKELQAEAAKIAEERFKIDASYVLKRLADIDQMDVADILDNTGNFLPIQEWPKVWRTTLSGIDIQELMSGDTASVVRKIKWPDKVKNLELLGKHVEIQAFSENHKHSGAVQVERIERVIVDPPARKKQ